MISTAGKASVKAQAPDIRLLDALTVSSVREEGRVLHDHRLALDQVAPVYDGGRGDDEVHIVLTLQSLLDNLHVQQAEEATAEAKAHGRRDLQVHHENEQREYELHVELLVKHCLGVGPSWSTTHTTGPHT